MGSGSVGAPSSSGRTPCSYQGDASSILVGATKPEIRIALRDQEWNSLFSGCYSPAECIGARTKVVEGRPDPKHVSTSYVECQNLTMRMHTRRFTRLTNAFSKKVENHAYTVALHFVFYNFVRIHKMLRVTPAMAAGLTERLREVRDLVALVQTQDAAEGPKARGPYESRQKAARISD